MIWQTPPCNTMKTCLEYILVWSNMEYSSLTLETADISLWRNLQKHFAKLFHFCFYVEWRSVCVLYICGYMQKRFSPVAKSSYTHTVIHFVYQNSVHLNVQVDWTGKYLPSVLYTHTHTVSCLMFCYCVSIDFHRCRSDRINTATFRVYNHINCLHVPLCAHARVDAYVCNVSTAPVFLP